MQKKLATTALVIMLASGSALRAQVITSTNATALTGATLVDFSSFSVGSAPSYTFGNATITGLLGGLRVQNTFSGNFGTTGQYLDNAVAQSDVIRFTFATSVTAFGIGYGAQDNLWNLFVYDAGNNLIGFSPAVNDCPTCTGLYIGWESMAGNIASAELVKTGASPDWVMYDDFKFVSGQDDHVTPEPVSMTLLGTGLAGIAAARRRRKQASQA